MPPRPRSATIWKLPSLSPRFRAGGRSTRDEIGEPSRNELSSSAAFSRDAPSARSSGSSGHACRINSARCSAGCCCAASNSSSTFFQSSAGILGTTVQFALEPGLGQAPIADNGVGVHAKHLCRLLHVHPAEGTQPYDLCLALIDLRQACKCVVQGNQSDRLCRGEEQPLVKRHAACSG